MKVRAFPVNKNGKIELLLNDLQYLLDDAYNEGYEDGKRCVVVSYPYTTDKTQYITYCTTSGGETK